LGDDPPCGGPRQAEQTPRKPLLNLSLCPTEAAERLETEDPRDGGCYLGSEKLERDPKGAARGLDLADGWLVPAFTILMAQISGSRQRVQDKRPTASVNVLCSCNNLFEPNQMFESKRLHVE